MSIDLCIKARNEIIDTRESSCDNCRFWEKSPNDNHGTCLSARAYNLLGRTGPNHWTECGENTLATDPDFCCMLHERGVKIEWSSIWRKEDLEEALPGEKNLKPDLP